MEVLFFLFGFLGGFVFSHSWCEITRPFGEKLTQITGYHFHHTILGVMAIMIAFLFSRNKAVFLLGWGLAIIAHDILVYEKKLVFITKE